MDKQFIKDFPVKDLISYERNPRKIIKGKRSNIEWNAYPEDSKFTNLFPRKYATR